jgi:phospholipid/cholesterol/gamma-HCH transport system substrate-binding protein
MRERLKSLLSNLREFVDPQRKAGSIPLGRIAIVAQIIGAAIFVGYTLVKKDIQLPFSSEPYRVEVVFPDAKGLDPADEPAAAVAGSPVGRVEEVRYENGTAIATLRLDSEIEGKLFADATAALRPASALQNLLVNVDPGSPDAGPLPEGEPIPPERTDAFVSIDELTSTFDADTQAYLQILITEAERALRGRDGELRSALAELGELTETARPVSRELAKRRELLTRLVGHLDQTFSTVALRGRQLGTAIEAGNSTLAVTAARREELTETARLLGPLVEEAHRSLAATRGLTEPLGPALQRIAPAARTLPLTARRARGLIKRTGAFTGDLDELTQVGAVPVSTLVTASEGLESKAKELIPIAEDLAYRATLFNKYRGGLPQLADTLSGAFSVRDNGGVYGQVDVLKFEPAHPENFGFSSAAASARSADGDTSRLDSALAKALELSCRTQSSYACFLRFSMPRLPPEPILPPLKPKSDAGKGN